MSDDRFSPRFVFALERVVGAGLAHATRALWAEDVEAAELGALFDAMGRRVSSPSPAGRRGAGAAAAGSDAAAGAGPAPSRLLAPSLLAPLPRLSPAGGAAVLLLLAGAAGFRALERWSLVDCLYESAGVLTTVGITLTPTRGATRAFIALLNAAGLGVGAALVADVRAHRARRWAALVPGGGGGRGAGVDAAVGAATVLLGAAAMAALEGWPPPAALYWAFTVATGLGMESIAPETRAGRLLFVVYAFAALGAVIHALSSLGDAAVAAAAGACAAARRAGGRARGGKAPPTP